MRLPTDVRVVGAELFFLPIEMRTPYKFGSETLTRVTCARCRLTVADSAGRTADGWGETPLSVPWVWPSTLPYVERFARLQRFCEALASEWPRFGVSGHALEVGWDFHEGPVRDLWNAANTESGVREPMPWLAALVCSAAFDIAVHDAYGHLNGVPIYSTYNARYLSRDLRDFFGAADPENDRFAGRYPGDYLITEPPTKLKAWHSVGSGDALTAGDLNGDEPNDEYPNLLADWIVRDGLTCLKIKLRGNDFDWDYKRIVGVGRIGLVHDVDWLSLDFNCTVREPAYVNEMLDRLRDEHPRVFGMVLYVEQPFSYDLEAHPIDVHSVAARKPLFLDESAHDWRMIRLGRFLGWNGVALKTCKTQTSAILSACWAREHGMGLMVQDLTNPMLAQIPHLLLAAHVGTIMGLESNAMQFYPAASSFEAAVYPGAYTRAGGMLNMGGFGGPGFGFDVGRIGRPLPDPSFLVTPAQTAFGAASV